MGYSESNPPALLVQPVGTGIRLWSYSSADAETTFDDAGYITNAGELGMKTGDVVFILDTGNGLSTIAQVTVTSGVGTLTPLTAIT